jgi:hypothetical protein
MGSEWRSLSDIETVPIASLTMDPENARKHSRRNLEAIAGSLSTFGQRRPLVVWDGIVIAGNGTLEAAQSLGWEKIGITRVPADWTHEQARAYALADNRTAELADWDHEILADQLIELDSVGYEISDWGFQPLSPPSGDAGDAFTGLSDADRPDATQITFTLTLKQADEVQAALAEAKRSGRIEVDENVNSNGNAIHLICSEWMQDVG